MRGYTVDAIQQSPLNSVVSFTNGPGGSIYQLACPPSILRSAPVMYELAGLRRNTAAPLKSSGLLSFPSIFCAGLLYFSRSVYILSGGAREHRDTVSVLPICLNKAIMGWRSPTSPFAARGRDGKALRPSL